MKGGQGKGSKETHQEKGESGWENTTPRPSFITDRQT